MDGLIGSRIPDKEERTEGCDFPERIHIEKIVRHDQAEHGGQEEEDHEEEERPPVLHIQMLPVEYGHVPQGVNGNEAADDAGNEDHNDSQVIDAEIPYGPGVAAGVELKGHDEAELEDTQRAVRYRRYRTQ